MSLIEVGENSVYQFEKLEWRLVVELHHRKVLHERRSVQSVNNDLDLRRVEVGRLAKYFGYVCMAVILNFACAH